MKRGVETPGPSRVDRPARGLLYLTLLVTLVGCDPASPPASSGTQSGKVSQGDGSVLPLKIVATTGMVADMVTEIVGEHGSVTALMGPGADPHLYKPTRNDVRRMLSADVLIYSGLQLEHRLQETIEQIGRSGKPVFAVTDGVDRGRLRPLDGSSDQFDPHVWMDVSLWSECVVSVAEELSRIDETHAKDYRERAQRYSSQLHELDEYVHRAIASIPEESRVLVTAHDAFGYFSDRYGIEVRAVQGVSTESEAGVQDINRLVDLMVTRKIPALFVESSVNPKSLQAVLEGCQSRGVSVRIGGELYSDAMGPAQTYEGTYLGMLDANSTRITLALGGDVPPAGWQSRLTVETPEVGSKPDGE